MGEIRGLRWKTKKEGNNDNWKKTETKKKPQSSPGIREISRKRCQMYMEGRIWEKKFWSWKRRMNRVMDDKSADDDTHSWCEMIVENVIIITP